MDKLKKIIILFVSFYFLAVSLIIYSFLSPDFSKKECEAIRANFGKIKIGMSKEEILMLIKKEPDYQTSRYPGVFREQKTVWEFWLLCSDPDSCVVINPIAKQCSRWQIVAFDYETEKVVKIFDDEDELERIGFD